MKSAGNASGKPEMNGPLVPLANIARTPAPPLATPDSTMELEALKDRVRGLEDALARARTEVALTKRRHEEFYDAAPVGYLEFDHLGTIRFANSTVGKLLDQSDVDYLIGKPFSVFLRGDSTIRFSEHLRICLIHKRRHRTQLTIYPRNQPPVSVFLASVPVLDEGKAGLCRSVMVDNTAEVLLLRDYTERFVNEQTLRREAEQERDFMRLVLSHSPVILGSLEGPNLKVKWLNAAGEQTLGVSGASDQGKPVSELLPGLSASLTPLCAEVFKTGKPLLIPEVLLPVSSGQRWFRLALAPLSKVMPHPPGLIFVGLDISDNKESTNALSVSENRLRLALHAARMATCDWDFTAGRISWSGHPQLFGGTPLSTLQTYESLKAFILPDDFLPLTSAIDQASRKGGEFTAEFRIRWSDQSIHWMQLQGQIFLDGQNRPIRMLGVLIETTTQKLLEKALRENQEELEKHVRERTAELGSAVAALKTEATQRKKVMHARDDLVRQLSAAQEDERRRISRELHDETGQHLTALLLGLKNLQPYIDSPAAGRQLKELQELAARLGEEIHRIAVELRPTALDDLGLQKTITNFLEQWSERSGVSVDLHVEGL